MAAMQPVRPWWTEESSIRTVKSLLEQKGLREEDCNREITDQDIQYIYCNRCEMWRELSPLLSMPNLAENDIDRDHIKEREKRRAFFLEWKDIVGSDATYLRLIGALLKVGHRKDAEAVCELALSHISLPVETDNPPDAATTTITPAYPPKIIKCLQYQLNRYRDEVMYHYAAYVSRLCECIEKKKVTVKNLALFLLNLPALKYHHDKYHHTKLLASKRAQLRGAGTIDEIFDIVGEECASFLNYGIFKSIASRYGVSSADHEDLNYSEHLKKYLNRHRVSELIKVVKEMGPLMKENDATKMEIMHFQTRY